MCEQTVASTKRIVKGNALPLHAKQDMTAGTKWKLLLLLLLLLFLLLLMFFYRCCQAL
jgi:hypothetical protein